MAAKKASKKKVAKPAAAKAPAKKAAKKPAAKKAAPKKAATKKTAPKKAAPKKTAAKKAPKKVAKKAAKPAKQAAAVKAAPAAAKKTLIVPPKKPALTTPKNSSSKQYSASEFYEVVKEYCGFMNRRVARDFYEQFADMISVALKSGYKVVLPGLGKIQVRKTKARMGRNPATQEPMMIPAKRKVAFTPLKSLKESVL